MGQLFGELADHVWHGLLRGYAIGTNLVSSELFPLELWLNESRVVQ